MYQWWSIALLLQQLGQQRMTYCQICCAANKEREISSRLCLTILSLILLLIQSLDLIHANHLPQLHEPQASE